MGKYSVPENIRKFKPKGTMVKLISGNYYVYEYKMIKGDDGKRHTKMGSLIGTIKEGIGFIPNNSFVCDAEISTLDYGDYAKSCCPPRACLSASRKAVCRCKRKRKAQ